MDGSNEGWQTQEERIWAYLLKYRATTDAKDLALNCDITEAEAQQYIDNIGSPNWRETVSHQVFTRQQTRTYNVGASDYSRHKIQPWDIWLEYRLNPWDADIVKRVLRSKPGERRLDYEKIKHICDERIRQIDEGLDDASVEPKTSSAA
jgi:hypothetical protein